MSYEGFPDSSVGKESAVQETLVRFLGQEDPPEKGWATHSSILAWRIPWTCIAHGFAESDTTERLSLSLHVELLTIKLFSFHYYAWISGEFLINSVLIS